MGVSQLGCFMILDEFNKLNQEAISIVSQQFQLIREALLKGSLELTFFNKTVILDDQMQLFVTFNP